MPVLLGGVFKLTNNRFAVRSPSRQVRNKLAYERLEIERFCPQPRHPQFKRNPHFPVNTLQIMRGAVAAEADGDLAAMSTAVFHHMWEEPRKWTRRT